MNRELLFLDQLGRYSNLGLLIVRALCGAFLVYGVVDNVFSDERMHEFALFLEANGFPAPGLMAVLSVYLQLMCGIALFVGLLTRWAGLIIAVHFVVAVIMVHWSQDFRGWWPAIVIVAIGLQFAFTGPGRCSLDATIREKYLRRRVP